MPRRRFAVLLVCVIGFASAPAADAAVRASVTMQPTVVGVDVSHVVYRLTLSTDTTAHVAVRLVVPTWGRPGDPLGGPIGIEGHTGIEGPGHLDEEVGRPIASAPLMASCERGPGPGGLWGAKLTLPANSSTALVFTAAVAPLLWPDSDLRLGFQIAERAPGDLSDPPDGAPILYPQPAAVDRPLGTRVALHVGDARSDVRIGAIGRAGHDVLIGGTTDPPLARQPVTVTATGPRGVSQHLGTPITDDDGRFTLAWQPRRPQQVRITAEIAPADRSRAPDRSCPQAAVITAADGSITSRTLARFRFLPPARIRTRHAAVNRFGVTTVPVACTQAAPCSGRLLLRLQARRSRNAVTCSPRERARG